MLYASAMTYREPRIWVPQETYSIYAEWRPQRIKGYNVKELHAK